MRIFLGLFLIWLGLAPAIAEETATPPAYLDDRSDAGALVRSLYNAVNRHEYARAWSCFATPPSRDFAAFVKGYDDTQRVDVVTGRIDAEGAAGSVFSEVPVAIRATDKKGGSKIFAGCYTIKSVNPQIQDPPFRALLIDRAKLKPVEGGSLARSAPERCGVGEAPKEAPAEELVRASALFADQHRTNCTNLVDDADGTSRKPAVYELRFRQDSDAATDPERLYRLYKFACSMYAYNASTVYYLADDYGEISQLSFAEPETDIKYSDEEGAKLKSMVVDGFTSTGVLINSSYDTATLTLSSFSKWRGVGDASSAGNWVFKQGQFILKSYEIDPTTDGEINPIPVIVDGKVKP
jgi:Protein of unknown function (DUF1176)